MLIWGRENERGRDDTAQNFDANKVLQGIENIFSKFKTKMMKEMESFTPQMKATKEDTRSESWRE